MVYSMTIRITVSSEGPEVFVCLAGRLSEGAIKEFIDTCDSIEANFVLDLSKLLFADDAGVDVIRAISQQGAKIRGASPFIQLLLDGSLGQDVADEEGLLT